MEESPSRVTNLIGHGARRAAFVEHVKVVGGEEGTEEPANEGLDAHRVSSELQGIARENTPVQTKAARRARIRHRIALVLLAIVFAVALAWVADNVVGYFRSPHEQALVSTDRTVQLASGAVEPVDCWQTGSVQEVWRTSTPLDRVVPYRCGDTPVLVVAGGVMSSAALGLAVLSGMLLVIVDVRRRRTNFWY
jgi:hypothetical protein